ncbi:MULTISPECIES: hypothetical protein [Bradyrhizobium]|uniref:Uncharacterized protein n=1 Tax=Bradyrhizobium elkanii TaxID=29448 RepID=A0A4U6S489_BRAEL|nr:MULTISPECIES: hypothetical protein [Bradyrhizobium]MTV12758.1 hypothetical protein [Bradyrhizobium sp. BR2003]TKV82489.1 hypothetical protein FDV58_08410 [Bradyrhizobium elkanii]
MLSDPKATVQGDVPLDTVWSILEAANELGDTHTVDACRRVIDANLRGDTPRQSDLNAVAAFFA